MENVTISGDTRQKATGLLYKYNGLLREIIAQRSSFKTEREFWTIWAKIAGRINQIQGYMFRHSICLEIPDIR